MLGTGFVREAGMGVDFEVGGWDATVVVLGFRGAVTPVWVLAVPVPAWLPVPVPVPAAVAFPAPALLPPSALLLSLPDAAGSVHLLGGSAYGCSQFHIPLPPAMGNLMGG